MWDEKYEHPKYEEMYRQEIEPEREENIRRAEAKAEDLADAMEDF